VERRINSGELRAMYLVSGAASSDVTFDSVLRGQGVGVPGDVGDAGQRAPGVVDVEVVEADTNDRV
jgi:hypothetical protein